MASLSNGPNGTRIVQFIGADKKRRSIRLGKMPKSTALGIKVRVERLNAAAIALHPIDDDTARWLGDLDEVLSDKLADVGLIPKRESALLEPFIEGYIESRVDVKPATKEVWRQGKLGLVGFFVSNKKPNPPLREITAGDADSYKLHMVAEGLKPYTIRKRLQFATTIFRAALRKRLVTSNPFADVKIKVSMEDRKVFISQSGILLVMDKAPDHNWRAIVALARFGGLRCPSEVLSLRWQDIDWEGNKIVVTSPKTAHHPGKETRTIPLFNELRPWLEEAWELAPEGAVYVVDERFRKSAMGVAGWRNCNLATTFKKIIERAGLRIWPRPFHNLRSSRQTELAAKHPTHVVCGWMGNSPDIAKEHYLQITQEDFQLALQNPVQYPAIPERKALPIEPDLALSHGPSPSVLFGATQSADGEGFEPPVDLRLRQFSRLQP